MHAMRRMLVVPLSALGLLLLAVGPVAAAEFRAGDQVTIAAGETIADDVYLAAGTSTIEGTIQGDLTVAGGIVDLRGTVTGSVNVAGGNVTIGGNVDGAVRILGGNVTISGQVGRDVVAAAGNLIISSGASVGADVAGGVGRLEVAGTVNGDVLAGAGELTIRGSVGGDVDAEVGQLRIESGASVAGSVRYGSERDAQVSEGAQVGGAVERRDPQFVADRSLLGANPLTAFLGALLALLLLGWGLMLIRPTMVVMPGVVLRTRALMSFGAGLAMWLGQFVLLIVLVVLAALAAQLAAALGGAFLAPLTLVVLAIIAVILLAQVWVAMAIGSLIATRSSSLSPWVAYALGAVIWVAVVTTLSFIAGALGGVLFLLAWIAGIGALTLYVADLRRRDALVGQPPAAAVGP